MRDLIKTQLFERPKGLVKDKDEDPHPLVFDRRIGGVPVKYFSTQLEAIEADKPSATFPEVIALAIDWLKSGKVVPFLYDREKITIPKSLPFIIHASTHGNRVLINLGELGNLADINRNKPQIQPKKFQLFLVSALLIWKLNFDEEFRTKLLTDVTVLQHSARVCSSIFAKELEKTFDRRFWQDNTLTFDSLCYAIARFFLAYSCETPDSLIDSVAAKCTHYDTPIDKIQEYLKPINLKSRTMSQFVCKCVENFFGLKLPAGIEEVAVLSRLADKCFGATTPVALEYYPFFIHSVLTTCNESTAPHKHDIEAVGGKELMQAVYALV